MELHGDSRGGPSTGTYPDLSQVFGYDSLSRLVSANLAAGQTQSFAYTRSFTYDNAGNVTASAGITYVYDGRGRMKQAGATAYLVNGLGQRVKKSSATDTYFAYDEAGHLVGEYDASGSPIQETVWLGDFPVAVLKPKAPSGFDLFYVWADHLGTPRQITDVNNQSRWEWAHNDPFGNNAPNENPAGLGAFAYNLRFPGQYFDAETGTHYNYFRDYDPTIGRYIQADPIGVQGLAILGGQISGGIDFVGSWFATRPGPGGSVLDYEIELPEERVAGSSVPWMATGLSLYGYVDGNPLRFLDAFGLNSGDKWYGFNDPNFRDWVHQAKQGWGLPGGYNFSKDEHCSLNDKWKEEGSPRGKGGKSGKGGQSKGKDEKNPWRRFKGFMRGGDR